MSEYISVEYDDVLNQILKTVSYSLNVYYYH
jgi:hypothetical protein